MGSWACFLVPTNRIVSPPATVSVTNERAASRRCTVWARSMMWIPLRSAKMYGFILGFQRRVWCPKWTPASSSWRIETDGMGRGPPVRLDLRELSGPADRAASAADRHHHGERLACGMHDDVSHSLP